MSWLCRNCGKRVDSARLSADTEGWQCPHCGSPAQLETTEVQPPADASAETVFQPALMMDSILDELETLPRESADSANTDQGTETLAADPGALPSPFLQIDVEAFLLILGAPPGQERFRLTRAQTAVGRRAADIVLADPAMSGQHFQIEAFGREFFLRDLDSRNGTYLNGTRTRYSQLLPGDRITAGKTSLIFRTSDDSIDR